MYGVKVALLEFEVTKANAPAIWSMWYVTQGRWPSARVHKTYTDGCGLRSGRGLGGLLRQETMQAQQTGKDKVQDGMRRGPKRESLGDTSNVREGFQWGLYVHFRVLAQRRYETARGGGLARLYEDQEHDLTTTGTSGNERAEKWSSNPSGCGYLEQKIVFSRMAE